MTRPDRRVATDWSVILEAADASGVIDPRRDRLSVMELKRMEAAGLVLCAEGTWMRNFTPPGDFVPFVCGDCGTWRCLVCGHARDNANRYYAGDHGCARCHSTRGRMEPTFHMSRRVDADRHRPAGHPAFALDRLAETLNTLQDAGTDVRLVVQPNGSKEGSAIMAGRSWVRWNNLRRRWLAAGPGRAPLNGSVVIR